MRTLFLLAILVTLVTIAVKKPNQTAWDAVRQLGDTAQAIMSNSSETAKSLQPSKTIKKVAKKVQNTLQPKLSYSTNTEPQKPVIKQLPTETGQTPTLRTENLLPKEIKPKPVPERQPETGSSREKPVKTASKEPEQKWTDLPEIAVKSLKAKVVEQEQALPVIEKITSFFSPRSDYADVKVYYENASRLLEEMK